MKIPVPLAALAVHLPDVLTVRTERTLERHDARPLCCIERGDGRIQRFQLSASSAGQQALRQQLISRLKVSEALAGDLADLVVSLEQTHPFNEWALAGRSARGARAVNTVDTSPWAEQVWAALASGPVDAVEVQHLDSPGRDGPPRRRNWVCFGHQGELVLSAPWPALVANAAAQVRDTSDVEHAQARRDAWTTALGVHADALPTLVAALAPLVLLAHSGHYSR